VKTTLPADVAEFAVAARRQLERLGGPDLALRAERDRSLRGRVGAALQDVGIAELDVRADLDQFLAAAQLCRVAGGLALPWPVVEDLLAVDGRRLALVDLATPRVDHGDLPGEWLGSDLDGSTYLMATGVAGSAKLGPFLVSAEPGAQQAETSADDIARHLILGSWRILGSLEAALGQVVAHVGARTQFHKTLSEFQAVRFAIADASVALRGLEELAKYTSWRMTSATPALRHVDAIALRLFGIDTATQVLRICHQLLGAVGFCDEHDVSVFDRHLQPLLRLPASAERLALRLVPAVRSGDFESLYS
jgi:acyl-CoA dehydrogenase